jgi:hypothetical protein
MTDRSYGSEYLRWAKTRAPARWDLTTWPSPRSSSPATRC